MRRALLLAAALGLGSCGEPPRLGLTVVIPLERVGAITLLQAAALPDPDALPDCAALTDPCLAASGHAGAVEVVATAPFDEAVARSEGQVLLLEGLAVGQRYRIVVEAISEGAPPAVEASGCGLTEAIVEGDNEELEILLAPRTGATCDAKL